MASKKNYLTKRQKQIRITKAQKKYKVRYTEKQLKKITRAKTADEFQRRLSRTAGAIKGGKTTKLLSSERAYRTLKKRENKLNKLLDKHPEDKSLIKAQLANTKRLNRILEKDPNLTPQERENMQFRHRNREAELNAAAHGQEDYKPSRHGWSKEEFVKTYFSTEYYEWKAELEEQYLAAQKENNKKKMEEIENQLAGDYDTFFEERLSENTKPDKQHSGRLVFKKDDIEEIIYS